MYSGFKKIFSFGICFFLYSLAIAQPSGMVLVKGGSYLSAYVSDTSLVTVGDFMIDQFPVTNAEFLVYVEQFPNWRKSQVKQLFAEETYLLKWKSDNELGAELLSNAPVTYVSWFAAKNYCKCQGKRLPTMDEWEYMAMADATEADARSNSGFNQTILAWYQEPAGKVIPEVGNTVENYWGVFDLHGLVWEWVLDFNAVMISGESRNDTALDRNLYCAGSVLGATDPSNYAAFMRYAFRGSLEANYALKNLGFRCALSIDQENQ